MTRRKTSLLCALGTLVMLIGQSEAYSGGAPVDACNMMTPRHGASSRSTDTSPFVVLVSKKTFSANENIMVMMRGLCKNTFRGFLVEARRADPRYNQTERVGAFTAVQHSRFECGREGALTHITNDDKSSLLFNWTAPAQAIGDVIITATFVQRFSTFFVGVKSAVIKDLGAEQAGFKLSIDPNVLVSPYIEPCAEDLPQSSTVAPSTTTSWTTPTTPTTTPSTRTTPSTVSTSTPRTTTRGVVLPTPRGTTTPTVIKSTPPVDVKCGSARGCFRKCEGTNCQFDVQWRDMDDRVWFSIKAKLLPGINDQWLALGFSEDRRMGDDSVIECIVQGNSRSLSMSFNYHHANRRIAETRPVLFPFSTSVSGGYLTCEFTRIKHVTSNKQIYDLGKQYFLFLAQGPIKDGRMERHSQTPWVSRYHVDLQSSSIVQPAMEYKMFIKIHACAMIFAWMFCASIAIVLARFYKPLWPQSRMCGRKIWFTVHRLLMLLLTVLVVGAFIVIFLEVKGLSDVSFIDFRKFHPILGIIVTGLTIIQAFMGLCRPSSSSKNRPVFNWAHWCVGILDHILAVGNIILGVGLQKAGLPFYVSYIVYGFAAYQVFIVLVLEVVTCNSRIKERKQQSYSIYADRATKYSSAKDTNSNNDSEPPGSFARRILLYIHLLVVTAFTAVIMITILL